MEEDKPGSWLAQLRRHRLVAGIILTATILGGAASVLGNIDQIMTVTLRLIGGEKPSIVAFSLSPSARGYEETREPLFAEAGREYRTFGLIGPEPPEPPVPVLLLTIANPTQKDLVITEIKYHVSQIGGVRGGVAGPLTPLARYRTALEWRTGVQARTLAPAFLVPAHQTASLEVQVVPTSPEPGLGWLMRIGLETTAGEILTDDFQLYMPKAPTDQPAAGPDTGAGT